MITDPRDTSMLLCPECGLSSPYKPEELTKETEITAKFSNNKSKMLLQKNNKTKQLRAEDGSEICKDDEIVQMDLAHGLRVLKYNEWKPDKVEKK